MKVHAMLKENYPLLDVTESMVKRAQIELGWTVTPGNHHFLLQVDCAIAISVVCASGHVNCGCLATTWM